jgi:hypothetical protein
MRFRKPIALMFLIALSYAAYGREVVSPGPCGDNLMPSLDDEKETYRSWGWSWPQEAEPNLPSSSGYSVMDPNIHGDTEGDDLWTYLMMYHRTGQQGYLDRAEAWLRYFKDDYRNCIGDGDRSFCNDRDSFGADHLYGWGLLAWYKDSQDADALEEAQQIGAVVDDLYSSTTKSPCLPKNGCTHWGIRQAGRHLLFTTLLAEATGSSRWIQLRDRILNVVLSSPSWDAARGMYFVGEEQTDKVMGSGAYASGARILSTFELGILNEAFGQAFRTTGRSDLKDRLVAMARFVDEFGLHPDYQYTGSWFGIVNGQVWHNYSASQPVTFWDPVYTTSLVNTLVRGYKYTGDIRLYERAKEFFNRGTKGIYGSPTERLAGDNVVDHFVDTTFESENFYLNYNKGELQYTYLIFENGGSPTVETGPPLRLETKGRTIEIHPGTDVFGPAAQRLVAGDTLIVHSGTYVETHRMSIQVKGTASAPISITAASGEPRPLVTRPADAPDQNTINIEGSTAYLTIRGLEITGNGGDGVRLNGEIADVTLEDLVIHNVDVGINFRSSMDHITVRRNHIYNTGINNGTGEGMYVGCNNATCTVRDSLIEQNWIHDTLPGVTQGDGIEVKFGSHSNVIRDNVIYNMTYPGIFVYGTGSNPANTVEGNVIWNTPEGIYAVADAVVRNNIVFNSGVGLSLYPHVQVRQMKNVTVVNNTLYNNNEGVRMRWFSTATNMIFANNAVYSPAKTALNLSGSAGTFRGNYIQGRADRSLDGIGFISGGSSKDSFSDPMNMNFWPKAGSPLIGKAEATYSPKTDFNHNDRVSPNDVGAYATNRSTSNPGWAITPGFKSLSVR